jgi:hypothetical protein
MGADRQKTAAKQLSKKTTSCFCRKVDQQLLISLVLLIPYLTNAIVVPTDAMIGLSVFLGDEVSG